MGKIQKKKQHFRPKSTKAARRVGEVVLSAIRKIGQSRVPLKSIHDYIAKKHPDPTQQIDEVLADKEILKKLDGFEDKIKPRQVKRLRAAQSMRTEMKHKKTRKRFRKSPMLRGHKIKKDKSYCSVI